MSRLPMLKGLEVIRALEKEGFQKDYQRLPADIQWRRTTAGRR